MRPSALVPMSPSSICFGGLLMKWNITPAGAGKDRLEDILAQPLHHTPMTRFGKAEEVAATIA